MDIQVPGGNWVTFPDEMSQADIQIALGKLYPTPPPGVMVHEADRSYITGPPGSNPPYVDTKGMDQAQRNEAAAALALRRNMFIGGDDSAPVAQQDPWTGQAAPYSPPSIESSVPLWQGVTQSLGDELVSGGAGAGNWLKGGSFGDTYNTMQEAQRQALAQQRQQNPIGSGLLQAGAALATAPLFPGGAGAGASATRQILGGGLLGGAFGGTEGFGSGSGFADRLERGAMGAGIGAGVGAGVPTAFVGGRDALDRLGDFFASPGTKALNLVGRAIRSDAEAGGPGPGEIFNKMVSSPGDVLPIDVAGENVRELGGQAARIPGPGRQQITSTFDARDLQAPKVLSQAVDTAATGTPGQSTFLAQRMLDQQARADSSPLYGKFEMQPPLSPDHLAEGGELSALMQRDSMKQATASAMKIAREQGVDPTTLGITFNEAGDPVFQGVPSWRTLDYMKRGMDDVVGGLREPITGKLDTYGNFANDTRRQFLKFLDDNNSQYAPARAAWSGPQGSQEALDEGSRIFTKHPDEIAYDLSQLSPTDQQFYRLGAANKLKTDLGGTTLGGNEALKVMGTQNRQDQIAAAFPNSGPLLDIANAEKLKFGTMRDLVGGQDTARRVAQDTSGGSPSLLGTILQGGASLLSGGYAGKSPLAGLGEYFASKSGGQMTPQIANEIAGRLLQSDPTLARVWLQNAFERNTSRNRPIY